MLNCQTSSITVFHLKIQFQNRTRFTKLNFSVVNYNQNLFQIKNDYIHIDLPMIKPGSHNKYSYKPAL